jgi:hypothetical protein
VCDRLSESPNGASITVLQPLYCPGKEISKVLAGIPFPRRCDVENKLLESAVSRKERISV